MSPQIPKISLPNGFSVPAIGLGTWRARDEMLENALDKALEAGYRLIDTATYYENEDIIGKVLKRWFDSGKLTREDVFITTKLPPIGMNPEGVKKFIVQSLNNLQLDYLDLYLTHMPFGAVVEGDKFLPDPNTDLIAIWKEMENQVDLGRTKYIGVSNYNIKQVQKILDNSRIKPVTNQVELHIYFQQNELVEFSKKNNITVTAYSPLGKYGNQAFYKDFGVIVPNLLDIPVVQEIAKKHGKTAAQVLLRQILQRGIILIPKSTNAERLKQNLDICSFTLDDEDMAKLKAVNIDRRIVDFKGFIPKIENHPEYPF